MAAIATILTVLLWNFSQAIAKPRHLEQLRTAMVARAARCVSCHVSNDGEAWTDAGLNPYGQRVRAVSPGDSMADRIRLLDQWPSPRDDEATKARKAADQDVDGDGVPNWVEILAGNNPGDAADKPEAERADRAAGIVRCSVCHSAINLPGKRGLEANPHNEYGNLLATTVDTKADDVAEGESDRRRVAEQTPILKRITLTNAKKPKGSKATYWEKLRLMRSPADEHDNPPADQLKRFRKRVAAQKSKSKRDPTRGIDDAAHPIDGFLRDAEELE